MLLIGRFHGVHYHTRHLITVVQRVCSTGFVFLHARTRFRQIETSVGQRLRHDLEQIALMDLIRGIDTCDIFSFHNESNDLGLVRETNHFDNTPRSDHFDILRSSMKVFQSPTSEKFFRQSTNLLHFLEVWSSRCVALRRSVRR